MYERSAVVLERYFADSFYYGEKNRLKTNFENFRSLIEVLEKYQEVSETEDKIIKECEDIASQIKQIQKEQGVLFKKIVKLQEERNSLFENIDESSIELGKQLDKIEKEIDKNNARMRPIDQEFIDTMAHFNEKSEIRSECGKKRRKIEKEYRIILEKTKQNLDSIDRKKISEIKSFLKTDDDELKEELKSIMLKNGEKESEPFDSDVVDNSIVFGEEIYKQEANILIELYERTINLLNEINNSAVKIKRYKKLSKDSKNTIEFINVKKEYLTKFLDNERLSVGLGKKEHSKLMKEACYDFQKDTEQIDNLDDLINAEISGEADQTKYEELYRPDYLIELQKKEIEFEKKLGKLNLVGQILNPINWRIEGIEKIYTTFDDIVSNEYERDLSRLKIEEIHEEFEEDEEEDEEELFFNEEEPVEDEEEDIEKPTNYAPIKIQKEKSNKIESEIENSDDIMAYYDNLDEEPEPQKEEEIEDDFESNFYRTFYNETDDFYDNEEENTYDDLETILKNRKKRASRLKSRKSKNTKKKGIFGLGNKDW